MEHLFALTLPWSAWLPQALQLLKEALRLSDEGRGKLVEGCWSCHQIFES